MGLDIGSTSYYVIGWLLLTTPWLIAHLTVKYSSRPWIYNSTLIIATLAFMLVNVFLIRHAHHLSEFPFIGLKWWPVWIFAGFKLILASFYIILIRSKCHHAVFLIICGTINLISVLNFEGFIIFLSLE
ncbi:hypothetical protein CW740_10710 [Kangiella profundi]|uniref:Uncharacterized protein n=1 Tax=Kangiella profundi TaxID=1561924 RepID=A0A2K9AAE0_9GAMM|nr:hypothetical protein CW740_10710 [Kangiella profundi]